ncbi:MAG: transaldolase [Candidatus Dormibacterales bacterium]|jgi:transaldolase
MKSMNDLRIKIFADGADEKGIAELAANPMIKGYTTNPTLMRAAGVSDYEAFAHRVLEVVTEAPISFEVFADEWDEMERQARKITTWGKNVFVKIPITNTRGESAAGLMHKLACDGIRLNITGMLTVDQVRTSTESLAGGPECIISVFAGRVADTGVDPIPLMCEALDVMRPHANLELLWASPRELLNIVQADAIGCHIITVTHDLLKKLPILGRDLADYSLDTVKMFHRDAKTAGFAL